MKNPCLRIMTMMIGLYFTGTTTNPSRKSSILFNSECQSDGYLLTNCFITGKHTPVDVSQTTANVDTSSSVFKLLLQSHMKTKPNIKEPDLGNNLILKIAFSSLTHSHGLERLSHSKNAISSISLDQPSPKSSQTEYQRRGWKNGLPFRKSRILDRNKLSHIPKGKWSFKRWTRPRNRACGELMFYVRRNLCPYEFCV